MEGREACASGWLHKIYIIFIPLVFSSRSLYIFLFLLLKAVFILDTVDYVRIFIFSPRFQTIQKKCIHNLKLYNSAALALASVTAYAVLATC